jgi:hypothetical protein
MCDAGGDEEREIDAALAKAQARQPELNREWNYLGDRPPITWTPDGTVWRGDVSDWSITEMDTGEAMLAQGGESVVRMNLDWAMGYAEVIRLTLGPPGEV